MRSFFMAPVLFVLAAAFFVTSEAPAFAQDSVAVGVKGGATFTTLRFENEEEASTRTSDTRPGFIGGLFVVWPADRRLALQTEVLLSQKGGKFQGANFSGRTTINYVDTPVLLRVSSARSGGTPVHVFAGPSFGFRVSGETRSTVEGREGVDEIDNDFKRFDLGLTVGAGVEFGRLVVDGRYTWGLVDIDKQIDESTIRNRGFAFMTGIRF
jgi:hypothetical protein